MSGTRKEPEDIDLTIIDRKDPRDFNDRLVPGIVHPPTQHVDRDQIVKPDADSSDSDSSVSDSDDNFDWDAEDDAKSLHVAAASIKAKRGHALYRLFLKLPNLFRVLLLGVIGAGILITPLLVVRLRFSTTPVKLQVYTWSLWLSISWAAAIITYLVVDAIPHFILVLVRLTSSKVERMRLSMEVSAECSRICICLTCCVACRGSAWVAEAGNGHRLDVASPLCCPCHP